MGRRGGTYTHWLRYASRYLNQDDILPMLELKVGELFKRGPFLREM